MKKLLISVYDTKAESWSIPVATDNKASAMRMFADLVSDSRTLVGSHPEDFQLWQVGFFDVSTGLLEQDVQHLANGVDFKKGESNEVRN